MSSTQQLLLGEGAGGAAPVYIEDVFSTYLFTGTGTGVTQRIAPGLDLATKGGMVWTKNRTEVTDHQIYDTARGERKYIRSNTTDAEFDSGANSVQYKTSGWDAFAYVNEASKVMASWTFRKQPKFFDVVTYTGTGSVQNIAHNLGSVPGCIIIKNYTSGGGENWNVYHRSLGNTARAFLDLSSAAQTGVPTIWNATTPTSSVFTVGTNNQVNTNGASNVAYLFAHDAGGFGVTGTDNVISCGSFTTDGSGNATVSLGYEPAWVLYKRSDSATGGGWGIVDSMRGFTVNTSSNDNLLFANLSDAETQSTFIQPNSTGFSISNGGFASRTYIYIAIRRGPMKVPTLGTSVFSPVARTGNSPTVTSITSVGFPPDAVWQKRVSGSTASSNLFDRLRGRRFLASATTGAETAADTSTTRDLVSFDMAGFTVGEQFSSELNANTRPEVYWNFRRAPSFFDEVCYTGTGSATTFSHNLAAVPELMIVKSRSLGSEFWNVYSASLGNNALIYLDQPDGKFQPNTNWNNTSPTSSVFSVSSAGGVNNSGSTYVAYLFATAAGVSKVGSYTGTGALQTVNCGFTTGARFVLIKRSDSTGDWWTYDSARGISSGNDPYLFLNSTAAEVTGTNYVDTTSVGFQVTAAAPAGLNASGGTYIFLAIA
jgi:hypothetical protein